MARRRGRKTTRNVTIGAVITVAAIGYIMIRWSGAKPQTAAGTSTNTLGSGIPLTGMSDQNGGMAGHSAHKAIADDGELQQSTTADMQTERRTDRFSQGLRLYELAQQNESKGDLVSARTQYNQALKIGLPSEQQRAARSRLVQMADEMLFGPKRHKGDPLVSHYVVQKGDNLAKIAKEFKVTADLLARINRLKDKNRIRAGQNLKVLHGPFHAEILKSKHVMNVFLQDSCVRQYKVGLGDEGSTPSGEWLVSTKLVNPTYYPPRGGKIIHADDPENPLGERWIGLEGLSGESAGQERYGIHGTNDLSTIGKNESLGCVRMSNDEVEMLYDMFVEQHSRVLILD